MYWRCILKIEVTELQIISLLSLAIVTEQDNELIRNLSRTVWKQVEKVRLPESPSRYKDISERILSFEEKEDVNIILNALSKLSTDRPYYFEDTVININDVKKR